MYETDHGKPMLKNLNNALLTFLALILLSPSLLHAETTFIPRISASSEYTDNVNRTPDNEEDELISTLSPGATLEMTGRVAGLSLAYDPTYAAYRDATENDGWRHYGDLSGWWDLSRRTRFNVSDRLVVSEDPADDALDPTLRRGRNRYYRNTADINLQHQFGREDSFEVGYTYSLLENEDELTEDSYRHNPYADLTWWFVQNIWGLELHGDFTRGEFEDSDDFDSWRGETRLLRRMSRHLDLFLQYSYLTTQYDGDTEDYKVHDLGAGFDYIVGENIDTSLAINYVIREREESDNQQSLLGTWDINALWIWRRTTLNLTGASGYTQDTFGAENNGFNVYSGLEALLEYRFLQNLSGDISGGYRFNRYIDFDPETEDHDISAGAGISWQALSWMNLRLQYEHSRLLSNEDDREFEENRIYGRITLVPDSPFRLF